MQAIIQANIELLSNYYQRENFAMYFFPYTPPAFLPFDAPIPNFFLSDYGLTFLKEHMRVSSTLITAPSLSNSPQ